MGKRAIGHWVLQGAGWMIVAYLCYAQAVSAIDYDLGVAMGTQEPAEVVTPVGVAFWYGFAFADLVFYIPVFAFGLLGYARQWRWGHAALCASLGITIYWPLVCLSSLVAARGATGWNLENETPYWMVLSAIAAWAVWGLWFVGHQSSEQDKNMSQQR